MSRWSRIDALDAVSRTRPLTDDEAGQMQRDLYREGKAQARLPARIMRLRAELAECEARIWPIYRDQLRALETADHARRLARIEQELNLHEGETTP